jgi:uroporphyrin-III C-methyltransferase
VVHDALVSPEILSLAPQARHELAGKRAGGVRTQQLRINDRLIKLAREGLRVVRLKGGDPLVFGRGGEEALALAAAAIPFRIVPGISAGIGGTAAAGIPLTHRHLARSVAFATGHDSSGELADVDWAALSRGSQVLVFYMAQRRIGQIAERLIAAGRPSDEPVALISNATRPDQDVRISTLVRAQADVAGIPAGAPTLIVVGPVIALRPLLTNWQQTEPMASLISAPDQCPALPSCHREERSEAATSGHTVEWQVSPRHRATRSDKLPSSQGLPVKMRSATAPVYPQTITSPAETGAASQRRRAKA